MPLLHGSFIAAAGGRYRAGALMFFRRHDNGTDAGVESLREELASLAGAARSGDCDAARRALHLRHLIGLAQLEGPAEDAGFVEPAAAPSGPDGLPEVPASELTAEVVRGAILDRGGLLVRNLVPEKPAVRIAELIDRALDAREALTRGDESECGRFERFEADPRWTLEERPYVEGHGGLWTVDSPFASAEVCGLFNELGLVDLAREYLREQPLLSVQKSTLRKVDPNSEVIRHIMGQGAGGGWHQDGKFLGPVKALNVWISLSRCGDVAPGMDLVPRRLEQFVATGTEGAPASWAVSPDVAADAAGDRGIVRPIFNPGDVLLFDEMFLHSTATEEGMPNPRFAVETWFFASSAFPQEYAPIAL
jgi:hypothetical protein